MRRLTALQGSLFGGHDAVRLRANGRAKVLRSVADGPKQLRLDGGIDYAHTKRNEANIEREWQDAAEGKVCK